MRSVRSVYRGYAIYVSGGSSSWSFRAEPITEDLPILTRAVFEGHASRGTALRTAKRQIATVLFPVSDWARYSRLEGAHLPHHRQITITGPGG